MVKDVICLEAGPRDLTPSDPFPQPLPVQGTLNKANIQQLPQVHTTFYTTLALLRVQTSSNKLLGCRIYYVSTWLVSNQEKRKRRGDPKTDSNALVKEI
jgi:hypothetical protein